MCSLTWFSGLENPLGNTLIRMCIRSTGTAKTMLYPNQVHTRILLVGYS